MPFNQCNYDLDLDSCTLQTCCYEQGYVEYPPVLGGNAAYLAIFAILLCFQTGIGLFYRTWGFWIGMVCGLILEIIGYAGRIMLRTSPFDLNTFLLYFIPLGLGPAFLTASIYLTLGRIVVIYGEQFSRFLPRTYTVVFVSCDILSLCIQAVGGALTASASDNTARQQGVDVLISGLTLQAFSLALFITLCIEFAMRVRKADPALRNPRFVDLRAMPRFKYFLYAIAIAAITIFVRCIYRVIELAQGFEGTIANEEVPFMILEGPLIMIAVTALTLFHQGIVFRGGYWEASDWRLRPGKARAREDDLKLTPQSS
ncbi:phospholipid-translocating ATPase rsb1 [Lecanora helva]